MRWMRCFSFVSMLLLAPGVWAALPACMCRTRCQPIPPPESLPCPAPPCACRLSLTLFAPSHAQELIDDLASPDWCVRRSAVEKLGSRLHADFCCNPAVLEAMIAALQCDSCWHVRRAAAAGILGQKAATAEGLLALHISATLDPHYLVRIQASESLNILTIAAPSCYKPLLEAGDKLIKELQAKKYRPGSDNCRVLLGQVCGACGVALVPAPPQRPAGVTPAPPESPERPPEKLDIPRKNR